MSSNAIEIQGTLREDGTLVLDEKPNLPPGRVTILVRPANPGQAAGNDAVSVLARIHAAQALRGHVPRSVEEINAEIEEGRDDERSQLIEQIQEECRRQREQRNQEAE